MKRLLFTATALAAAWNVAAQSRTETFTVESALLGREKTCSVYLPDGYDRSERSYPVLYLLHGASGCHTDWLVLGNARQILDEAIAEGRAVPMVVVMPDASGDGEYRMGPHMGYFDQSEWPYEQFFFEELLPAAEQRYRIAGDKANRAIAGLSMGGGGATVYAQHHPELFAAACPISALMTIDDGRLRQEEFAASVDATSPLRRLESLTDDEAQALRTVRWRVDCGDDDFLWEGNIRFYTLMRKRNIPLEFRMRDGGHTWRYWQTALPEILTFVSVGFDRE